VEIGDDSSMGIRGASFRALYNANGRLAGTYIFDFYIFSSVGNWILQP